MTVVEYASDRYHCVISVLMRRFFWSVFFRIRTKNEDLLWSFFWSVFSRIRSRKIRLKEILSLVKRNVVFGYILMYGDALPIAENKFSKMFLLIIFVFCQNRFSYSDLFSFILNFWIPAQQEVCSFTALSGTAQLFLIFCMESIGHNKR